MKFCTRCGKQISDEEIICDSCSKDESATKAKNNKKIVPFLIIFALVFGIMIYVFLSNYLHEKAFNERLDAVNRMTENITHKAQLYKESQLEAEISKGKRGTPMLGMTTNQVLETSWGSPNKINRTTATYGVHEQWVYTGGRYLYFEDGVLVATKKTVEHENH